jgi:hypothetical protein
MEALAGIMLYMLAFAPLSAAELVTGGPKALEADFKHLCEVKLMGKWEPKPAPADSCPGGKWGMFVVNALLDKPKPKQ